jgi:hypothetical protein
MDPADREEDDRAQDSHDPEKTLAAFTHMYNRFPIRGSLVETFT